MTELAMIRTPLPPEQADDCERCGTPLVLMTWESFRVEGGELVPMPTPERQWYDFTLWIHPETGEVIPRMFRPHTPERCTAARA